MPLFLFISGYVSKPQKVALKKINQKCGHILVPYVITTFFTIILSLIFESGIVLVKDHKTVFLPNMMKWLEAGVLGLGYRADYRGGGDTPKNWTGVVFIRLILGTISFGRVKKIDLLT